MEARRVTVVVLFDFSKAFDTVPIEFLLKKLACLGFDKITLRWFRSYLTGRTQAVVGDGGAISAWLSTLSGVPQGSILGPLLFSLFINDICAAIINSKYLLYADDLQIYQHCAMEDLQECIESLNEDIKRISHWALNNCLRLNPDKMQAIIFGAKRYINSISTLNLPNLHLDSTIIEFSPVIRNLGVYMDSKLTFSEHIQRTSSKINSTFYQLYQVTHYTDLQLRKLLVSSLIMPSIFYCLAVLNGVGVTSDLKLQRLANRGVRFIIRCPRDHPISAPRRELGWLSISNYRKYFLALLIRQATTSRQPQYLTVLLNEFITLRPRRAAVEDSVLTVPQFRTDTYRHSFEVEAPMLWNSIPRIIRDLPTYSAFKLSVKRWFLDNEVQESL